MSDEALMGEILGGASGGDPVLANGAPPATATVNDTMPPGPSTSAMPALAALAGSPDVSASPSVDPLARLAGTPMPPPGRDVTSSRPGSFFRAFAQMLPIMIGGAAAGAGARTPGEGAAKGAQFGAQMVQQRFENEQARHFASQKDAYLAASLAKMDQEMHQSSEEHQAKMDDWGAQYAGFLQDKFAVRVQRIPNTGTAASDHLQSRIAGSNGQGATVPSAIMTPSSIFILGSDGPEDSQNQFKAYNSLAGALGLGPMTEAAWNRAGVPGQNQMMLDLKKRLGGYNQKGELLTGDEARSTLSDLNAKIKYYEQDRNHDPDVLQQLQNSRDLLKSRVDEQEKLDTRKKGEEQLAAWQNGLIKSPEEAQGFLQKAADVLKDPNATPEDKQLAARNQATAQRFLRGDVRQAARKAGADENARLAGRTAAARATAQALGKDTEAMYKTGVNPITNERLTVDNAPDELLIDTNTGNPIPTGMMSTLKPTQQESNRADFARSTIHTLDALDRLKASGKLPNGPLSSLTTAALTKAGLASPEAQEAVNFISLAQSAATGAHVGGRFNKEIMGKMKDLLGLRMNDAQFEGAASSIREVMQQYVDQGGRLTVAQWKAMPEAERARMMGKSASSSTSANPKTADPFAKFSGKAMNQ